MQTNVAVVVVLVWQIPRPAVRPRIQKGSQTNNSKKKDNKKKERER